MEVHSKLGPGLLEACYHNGLYYELKKKGFKVDYNAPFTVHYDGHVVGEYFADLMVEESIIVELKSIQAFSKAHLAQVLNYLHISGCPVGLLVNFQGVNLEWKRILK